MDLEKGRGHVADSASRLGAARIARRLEALIGREHVSEDYVRFRLEVLTAQTRAYDAAVRSASSHEIKVRAREHGPLLDPDDVPLDPVLLATLFGDLLAACEHRGPSSEDVGRLAAAMGKDAGLLEPLARKAALGPDEPLLTSLARRLAVSHEALVFFGRLLSAPFVTGAVRRLKRRCGEVTMPSGSCPWCGSAPGLAKLKREEGEEGKRVLFCSLCGERWRFARLECPFCAGRDALVTLSTESGDPRSIEACDACKNYLKTVDERKLPEKETVVALVETTATVHLDLIAEKEGYARGLPYAALC